ncbi:protein ABIL1-like isoform X2 [Phoenix dactylifera]|uniref:Protein ABIL1-like isoform X2 n=1 Tax=Phoenix dactylifera TaxID=42345 RepID=A0A8B7CM24_PHODC|nr:protein ABIL1-like isoform X2 [Phoenix dactylifera]
MQQWRPENAAMTFDEVSMERSKSFVKALQELKNLRPQLYSAAEYCEKSYLHNEQKQMVLDNLKDYAVQAIVNAVDHLGTVAYKLTDLFEQQTLDVSTAELKISCLNQQILTCQTYTDKEGLRQQRMFTNTARHHKHYILPDSVSRRMQSCSQLQIDANLIHVQAKPRPDPPGSPASKTLSWLLASETNSASDGAPREVSGTGDAKAPKITSEVFHLLSIVHLEAFNLICRFVSSYIMCIDSCIALELFSIFVCDKCFILNSCKFQMQKTLLRQCPYQLIFGQPVQIPLLIQLCTRLALGILWSLQNL